MFSHSLVAQFPKDLNEVIRSFHPDGMTPIDQSTSALVSQSPEAQK